MTTIALPFALRRARRQRVLAIAGAVLATLIVYALGRVAVGQLHQPAFGSASPKALGASTVLVAAAAGALLGWLAIALLERANPVKAAGIWRVAAPVLLLVSLSAPLSGHGVSVDNRLVLVAMHLAVGAVIIPSLWATSPRREWR